MYLAKIGDRCFGYGLDILYGHIAFHSHIKK
jgi:hypothetical protein